jgi:hypothetical protein
MLMSFYMGRHPFGAPEFEALLYAGQARGSRDSAWLFCKQRQNLLYGDIYAQTYDK